jgi:hypothetical protein
MIAKIRELNVDDLNAVSGGVKLGATAARVPTQPANAQANQVMAAPSRPATSIQTSVSLEQLLARRY